MSGAPPPEEVIHPNSQAIAAEEIAETAQAAASRQDDKNVEFQIREHPVDNFRPIRVIVIGAGFCGIYCGIRISEKLRNVDLTIYEKNAGVGGTWYENRYPGCACDVPSHSYQYSFNPNPNWSGLYAPAPEIRAYLESTVKKYGVDRFTTLSHRVDECHWDEKKGKWFLQITDLVNNRQIEDSAEVVINARGALNVPAWPDIDGLENFEGKVMHSGIWDESYDFKNKRVGVIGSGSSSLQIVPKLQEVSGCHVTTFVRNKTWISPPFGQTLWDSIGMNGTQFTEDQKEKFRQDPEALTKFRSAVETDGNGTHSITQQGAPMQKAAQDHFTEVMRKRLASKPDIFEYLLPSFAPGCRRLSPGPGYLEALTQPNVDFITSHISKFEKNGIRTTDGNLYEVDAIACATGFKGFVAPPFPIHGQGDKVLANHWSGYPRTYLSLAVDGFPNHFLMLGPNMAINAGSLTIMMEANGDYIVKCIRKLQKENYKSMTVKPGRVDDFVEFTRAYFPRTVYKDECRSWFKNKDNDVTGLWPGSNLHCLETLRSPRWEDYEYENHAPENKESKVNQLHWLGNGWTKNQMDGRHMAFYVDPLFLDHEKPVYPHPEDSVKFAMRPFSN